MTNGLRQLEAQIKGLPDQEALKSQLEVFRNVANTAAERFAEFTKGKQQLKALRQISGDPSLLQSELDRWQRVGSNNSRDIARLLNSSSPEQSQITPKLAALSRMTTELKDRAATEWRVLCEAHQERAQTFKTLAERLDPKAARQLQEAAMFMRPGVTPLPTEELNIQIAIDARETLNRIMGSLQIEGPVERFLQAALQGTADAADLLDEQVQAYLNEHPSLWRSLKVVLK
jgi:hypothetical protein